MKLLVKLLLAVSVPCALLSDSLFLRQWITTVNAVGVDHGSSNGGSKEPEAKKGTNEEVAPALQTEKMENGSPKEGGPNTSASANGKSNGSAVPTTSPISSPNQGKPKVDEHNNRFQHLKPWKLCHNCFQQTTNIYQGRQLLRCGDFIYREQQALWNKISNHTNPIKSNNSNNMGKLLEPHLEKAATAIANQHPEHCGLCQPNGCAPQQKIYPTLDQAAPQTLSAWTMPIPKDLQRNHYVLPKQGAQAADPKAYFANPNNRMNATQHKFFYWNYNPSLIALKLDTHNPNLLPENLLPEQPVYLAYQRLSWLHNAFGARGFRGEGVKFDMGESTGKWHQNERTVFSFLREDMSVIDEIIVGIGYADFRLFLLNQQIYLKPFYIEKPSNNTFPVFNGRKVHRAVFTGPGEAAFEIQLGHKEVLCCANGCGGKNYNHFTTKDGQIWTQVSPAEPLEVQKMVPCGSRPPHIDKQWPFNNTENTRNGSLFVDARPIPPSFGTAEEPFLASLGVAKVTHRSGHRGTTCCLPVKHPVTQENLLVGISHRKHWGNSKWNSGNRQYTSNFYATQAEPPFQMVAMSGYFCMGHPESGDIGYGNNHLAPLTRNFNASFGEVLDCPRITFISTMLEKPGNPDRVLIGYGINDMMSRIVEVHKKEIVAMLFAPFEHG